MQNLRCAVVGVGYLGTYHAEKYALLPHIDLVGVCDKDSFRAEKIASSLNTTPYFDYQQLVGRVDAVSIVVPTSFHYEVAQFFLKNGIHVLLEKPMTQNETEARELIQLAKQFNCIFQIGHVERFNPVLKVARHMIQNPYFIECRRLSPFQKRGADVSVVLDLMIHDIDIIHSLIDSRLYDITASGKKVMSDQIDVAEARLLFENGMSVSLSANRTHTEVVRHMDIHQPESMISLDFHNRHISVEANNEVLQQNSVEQLKPDFIQLESGDALQDEIRAFVRTILYQEPLMVTGEAGLQALTTALRIADLIEADQ
jgi:predicted dehydrogenase